MKTIVIGANGQLGRDLCPRLSGAVIPLARDQADLTNPELLRTTLMSYKPDVIVNCAAYNFVDKAETEPEQAFVGEDVSCRYFRIVRDNQPIMNAKLDEDNDGERN